MKTQAAKARVNELRKALHQEQVDNEPHVVKTSFKKAGVGKTRPTPTKKGTASKSKAGLGSMDASSSPTEAAELAVDETAVSVKLFRMDKKLLLTIL